MPTEQWEQHQRCLRDLSESLRAHAHDLALYLIYDRPSRVDERPGLARTLFAERCVTDDQLEQMISAFRSDGAYVEVFDGEQPFLAALSSGRLARIDRRLQVAYNGIGSGVGPAASLPGARA